MNVAEVVEYWLESAEDDWPVVNHLIASGDYHYALFFGHLYLEKLLKALVVRTTGEHAPRTHNLLILAERAGLDVPDDKHQQLIRFTAYNMETRYPEERRLLRNRYSKRYTEMEIDAIQEVGSWLKVQVQQQEQTGPLPEEE